jgi:hypothetical protein
MKKLAVFIVMVTMVVVSCTGTFNLTKKVYEFQTKPADKWVDEVLFLAFAIIPVYGVAILADAVVFNSIDFWTGQNPIKFSANDGKGDVVARNGNDQITMKYDQASKDIEVTSVNTGKSLILARTDHGVVAKDREGKVLFTSVEDAQGGVTVLDGNNRVVKHYSHDDVQQQRAQFFTR